MGLSALVWAWPLACVAVERALAPAPDSGGLAQAEAAPIHASAGQLEPTHELDADEPELEPEPPPEPEPSGAAWVGRFPTSRSLDALEPPFRAKAEAFVAALEAAGARVHVFATRRPPERAYLMRYAWDVSRGRIAPADVPAMPGVDIVWDHGDDAASRAAAAEMVEYFWLAHRPSLQSRHIEGLAIDMHVTWTGKLSIVDGKGKTRTIASTPRNGADNRALHAVGASYGVRKLVADAPHWSSDGR